MYFYQLADRPTKELAPGITARTFWGEKMLMSVVDLEPNTYLPNHSHPHEQTGIVLEGELDMTIAGETRRLKVGDLYVIPGNVEHSARTGSQAARVLDTFSPVREEYKY
jgi:quercetin dioxygenase-like cupin family protein